MPSLSVAMIVKNESQDLAQCLETVKGWVDEIIILDSGSTDQTQEIAQQYGAKFYQHTNWQGFGKQRQIAQQYVTSDFVLWLDADERITPELQQSIKQAVNANKANTLYQIGRLSEVFGKQIHHSGWYPDYVTRLYPTKLTSYNDSLVHEKVIVNPKMQIEKLQGDLLHFTYKNLHHYLTKSAHYGSAWANQRFQQGKKVSLFSAFSHAFSSFFKMYILKKGFLDGKHGLLLATLSAQSVFNKYADLWIKQISQGK